MKEGFVPKKGYIYMEEMSNTIVLPYLKKYVHMHFRKH